jgi:hypothetical protein
MVLNFDETSLKYFSVTIQIKVIVSVNFQGDNIPVQFQRDEKRLTLLETIIVSEHQWKLLIIIHRLTCNLELLELNYTPDLIL